MNNIRSIKRAGNLLLVVIVFSLLAPQFLWSGEKGQEEVKAPGNIGFMLHPSQDLQDKFPMCDAFLAVNWISKEKRIGQSHFELYKDGNKVGVMDALVYLGDSRLVHKIELYDFKRKGELPKLIKALKNGKIVWQGSLPLVKDGSYKEALFSNNGDGYSYSDNRQNVCVAYPNNDRVWIVEGKRVGNVYSQNEIDHKYKMIKQFVPKLTRQFFEDQNIIDLNFDGQEDFIKYRSIEYSFEDQYYQTTRDRIYRKNGRKIYSISFYPKNERCELVRRYGYHLTFDGENYFLSNQCNLTALTKGE